MPEFLKKLSLYFKIHFTYEIEHNFFFFGQDFEVQNLNEVHIEKFIVKTVESLNAGKVYAPTYNEMMFAANTLKYYAGWCDKDHGKTIPWGKEFGYLNFFE